MTKKATLPTPLSDYQTAIQTITLNPHPDIVTCHLFDYLNDLSLDTKPFIEQVMRQHRTLQQTFFGLIMSCIEAWAKLEDGCYDGRNEYTVKLSRKIMAAVKDDWFGAPHLI